jgi:hypothetical protein
MICACVEKHALENAIVGGDVGGRVLINNYAGTGNACAVDVDILHFEAEDALHINHGSTGIAGPLEAGAVAGKSATSAAVDGEGSGILDMPGVGEFYLAWSGRKKQSRSGKFSRIYELV